MKIKILEPFSRNIFKQKDVTNLSKSSREYILTIVKNSNYDSSVPYEPDKYTIRYNENGGAQQTGASVDPYKNIMYVTLNNIPWLPKVQSQEHNGKKRIHCKDKKVKPLRDMDGYSAAKPPQGTLTAINLNNGKINWQVPLDRYEVLKSKGILTGTENFGGATATSGGFVFAAGTLDKMLRVFDTETGAELWSYKLPYISSVPPTSYEINDNQYIIITALGGTILKTFYPNLVELGDVIIVFKIHN